MTQPPAPRGSSTGHCASPPATTPIVAERHVIKDVRFEADLDLTVDGKSAHVSGDGASLIVEADDPAKLLKSLSRTAGVSSSRDLAGVADRLAERGASVRLRGPRGHVLTAGADANSRALRLLTGTRHVAPGSGLAALAMVSSMRPLPWRRVAVVGITVAMWVVIRRHLRPSSALGHSEI